ncbi:MAG: hypothetical protein LBP40_04725 [Campylobacteraceae bacterium]|nr:hypothetical protein [Campylobacteraceae bacterium]
MDFNGCCFFASDEPNVNFPHFIVIISSSNPEGNALLVPISSIKFEATGAYKYKGKPCKYYDDACVLEQTDIVTDNEEQVLNKPSFMRYEWAKEINVNTVLIKKFSKIYDYKCKISQNVLGKIQNGAKNSKELKPAYKKYFEYF